MKLKKLVYSSFMISISIILQIGDVANADVYYFMEVDEKVSKSYLNHSQEEDGIFSAIDIRRLCYDLQKGSELYTTIYNVNEHFYQKSIYEFSLLDVNLEITSPFNTTKQKILARKCHLLRDKTDLEIAITDLPKNINRWEYPNCVAILACKFPECVFDSVAIVESLKTNYPPDPTIFPVGDERNKMKSNIELKILYPNGLLDILNVDYRIENPAPYQKIMEVIDLNIFCSELQVASEFSEGDVYKLNPSFYSRHPKEFYLTMVNIGENDESHEIEARNCYLKNEKTNANIYLTSLPSKYCEMKDPYLKQHHKLVSMAVILECGPISCIAAALLDIQKVLKKYRCIRKKYSRDQIVQEHFSLQEFVNIGRKSENEYIHDLEIMYGKEKSGLDDNVLFSTNMVLLCERIHSLYPLIYVEADEHLLANSDVETITLQFPFQNSRDKIISARRCNLAIRNHSSSLSDINVYVSIPPKNTVNWTNIIIVLACSSSICSLDTLVEVTNFGAYALPLPNVPVEHITHIHFLPQMDEEIFQLYKHGLLLKPKIFSAIDIRRLCSNVQLGSRKHTIVYNVNEKFYRTSIYDFSIIQVSLRMPQLDIAVPVNARKCNLLKQKTGEEIFITTLPKNIKDFDCSECIAILTCDSKEQEWKCFPDSIAWVEEFDTNYLEDSKVFSVNRVLNREVPSDFYFLTDHKNYINALNQDFQKNLPVEKNHKVFLAIDISKFCSEIQLASELMEDAYKFNSNFYTRDISDFRIRKVHIGGSDRNPKINARNCYLRNETTNTNVYITAPTQPFTTESTTGYPHTRSRVLKKTIVVLECFTDLCTVTALCKMQDTKNRYSVDDKNSVTATYMERFNRPKLLSVINLGRVSRNEYLDDLEIKYEKNILEYRNSIDLHINMEELCNDLQSLYPTVYEKSVGSNQEISSITNVFLRMPRKFNSGKTVRAKRCNLVKKNPNANGDIYLTGAPRNTPDWTNIVAILACSSYVCLMENVFKVDDFGIYAMPVPKDFINENVNNALQSNEIISLTLTEKYTTKDGYPFAFHRIFDKINIKKLCGDILNNPELYQKIPDYENLPDDHFKIEEVSVTDDSGNILVNARCCNIERKPDKDKLYIIPPSEKKILEPDWKNKITILRCYTNSDCTVEKTLIIINFQEIYHIEPTFTHLKLN